MRFTSQLALSVPIEIPEALSQYCDKDPMLPTEDKTSAMDGMV
jgi:hypothetical protein